MGTKEYVESVTHALRMESKSKILVRIDTLLLSLLLGLERGIRKNVDKDKCCGPVHRSEQCQGAL